MGEDVRRRGWSCAVNVACGGLLLLGAGCSHHTSATPVAAQSHTHSATAASVAEAACQQHLQPGSFGQPEFAGRSDSSATVYGLPFSPYPLTVGRETKIAWRMTGSGRVRFAATGPNGQRVDPIDGPTPHTGSNWDRPGDEWGTFFQFPTRGCWTIHVTRGASKGTAGLLVS